MRKGMWACAGNKAGIVNDIGPRPATATSPGLKAGEVEFHEVDAEGDTVVVRLLRAGDVRQAKLEEIPEPRRPDAAVARKFGYV